MEDEHYEAQDNGDCNGSTGNIFYAAIGWCAGIARECCVKVLFVLEIAFHLLKGGTCQTSRTCLTGDSLLFKYFIEDGGEVFF